MKPRAALLGSGAVVLAAGLGWVLLRQPPSVPEAPQAVAASRAAPVPGRTAGGHRVFASDSATAAPTAAELSVHPGQPPDPAAAHRLEQVAFVIRDYRNAHSQNPTGTNAEITAALLGNNPRQIRFEVPEGSSVNPAGELCDGWGSPYFFHQLSGTVLEIRSAGPDRTLWTADDLLAR